MEKSFVQLEIGIEAIRDYVNSVEMMPQKQTFVIIL